ncbi:far upstream element-binding protein 2 [Drechmeria coniospora]|uniref:Far upstream element-binding protein 2 n=1 Tax=Drechmeria coniospora TaxID=98403 RepID=A0A151GMU7_DRECN|nr:far upstream element-binding protein 2 [Drechmeria coniospora]KYK58435.1 far upstream element-binding protein 2 [Drechmeria coniospora]
MAEPQPDIQSILAALGKFPTRSPNASQPPAGMPGHGYPGPSAPPGSYQPPPSHPPGAAPAYGGPGHALPAPAASGNVDLSAIRPVTSGTMNFDDIVSKARAYAADKGATQYDRPPTYGADGRNADRAHRRSRSRSPLRGSYRDERHGGQGRERGGRDRSYSPPPRGKPFSPPRGGGRERSPLRGGGDDNSETIQIESSLVGLIIGRQGENLRRIEADTNCRVQFLSATDGGPFRQCRISGPVQRRMEVKDAINRIIDDSGMSALNHAVQDKSRDGGRGGAAQLRDGEDHMQIMVPDRTVGLIIGRGGETIRDLQERSGCHINIVGETKSVNGLRPVNLIGSVEAAARAKDAIMEIVDSDTRGENPAVKTKPSGGGRMDGPSRDFGGVVGGGPDKTNDAMYVPSDAVGMIIGKGGETIREMQNSTGCKINVAQSSGPGEVQREIALIGSRDSIARAKMAIEEKVEAVRQKSGGGGGGGGRARGHQDLDRASYSQAPSSSTNQGTPAAATGDASDPYAQYGGYQNYVALWYQSLMYQQQQGAQGAPGGGAPAPGGPGAQ